MASVCLPWHIICNEFHAVMRKMNLLKVRHILSAIPPVLPMSAASSSSSCSSLGRRAILRTQSKCQQQRHHAQQARQHLHPT